MSCILEVAIGSDDFALGRALAVEEDVTITLEAVVPTGNRAMPYFWAAGENLDRFEAAVGRDPSIEEVHRHGERPDSTLYYAEWTDRVRSLLYGVAAEDGTILSGVGARGTWEFTLRFPSREHLSRFRERCEEREVGLDVDRVYSISRTSPDATFGLTAKQRETLVTALEQGYFEIPRETGQEALAESLGVRSSAVSETLRRATAELVANTLVEREQT